MKETMQIINNLKGEIDMMREQNRVKFENLGNQSSNSDEMLKRRAALEMEPLR